MHEFLSEWLGLPPKWTIAFSNSHLPLGRPVTPPVIDDGDALVVFGDSSAIYVAKITEGGQQAYLTIPATTYIHGWVIDSNDLYILDGVQVVMWSLIQKTKLYSLQLIDDSDVATAQTAFGELKKAQQSVEWATFLEQAEDEWVRLTAQQAACPSPSDERDHLDALAEDYFLMLKAIRKMIGSTGGSAAAKQKIGDLRKTLADKRKAAAPWSFSPPVVRRHGLQESSNIIFTMQGNGTLCACDKQLSVGSRKRKKWKDQAELQIALLDENTTAPKLVVYVSESTLYAVDAKTLEEKSHWTPATPPAVNTTHSLLVANGQFWWSTDSGVYACKPDDQSRLQPTWHSGGPWTTRQVGRLEVPETVYRSSPDPNDLFESMNVHGWITQRADRSAPLSDGMTAQLILSDENGRYVAPPTNTTHILYGPFNHDAASAASWGEIKPHPTNPLVLLSDSNKCSMFCRYPTPAGISQLLPQWTVTPFYSVTKGSAADIALAQHWPAPPVRQRSKPQPDMVDYLNKSAAKDAISGIEAMLSVMTSPRRHVGDREVRFVLWHGLFNHGYPDNWLIKSDGSYKRAFDVFYKEAEAKPIRDQFMGLGTTWDFRTGDPFDTSYSADFFGAKPSVDFDPPYAWKNRPAQPLFHKSPPPWYDPWGYNRPGDFVTQQPPATYFDPFCFNGQVGFPQRPITLDNKFKGRQWAVFTDTDAASLQASGFKAAPDASIPTDPCVLVANTNDDKQQTTFYMLPPKHLNVTYDAPSHEIHPETLPCGFLTEHVLACPTVFYDQSKIYPTAWCPGSKEYPSARLRKIATVNQTTGKSLWATFVDANKAQYGPSGSDTAWKIDLCPLPADALPATMLYGYTLPAPPH